MSEAHRALCRRHLASFHAARITHRFSDVIVVGSGVAGLSAALAASAEPGTEVLLLAKDRLDETATAYAQGGVAAVLDPEGTGDSIARHVEDTLTAGDGLGDPGAARLTAQEGVERVRELIALGARFDRTPEGELHFTLEGGHGFPRILHRGDTTGEEIQRVLQEEALARDSISTLAGTFAVDLLGRDGAVNGVLLQRPGGELEAAWAKRTVLATGGAGRLFRETTNPPVTTGDGIAMAFRAGAAIRDLELIQFHPTTLYVAGAERFLITEAARGEGGVLRDGSGERFLHRFHPLGDLAPRDVVSRGIITVLRERGENKVFLDLSAIPPSRIRERFPKILEKLKGFGIDILREPIPVRPSAHYSIGGVATDLEGKTSLEGLLAAGEVASTGLHGANRLASNSLLEGLVFGHRAGKTAAREARSGAMPRPFSVDGTSDRDAHEPAALDLNDLTQSLRSLLWLKVGLERNGPDLAAAIGQIQTWMPYVLGSDFRDAASWTVQNMLMTAYLLARSALTREESRGVHYRSDFPARDDARWKRHVTLRREELAAG